MRYPNAVDIYVLRESASQYSLRVEKDSAPVSCTHGDGTVEGDGEWTVSSVTDQTIEIFSVDGAGWGHGDQLSVSFGSVAVAPYSEATLGDANIGYSSLRAPSAVARFAAPRRTSLARPFSLFFHTLTASLMQVMQVASFVRRSAICPCLQGWPVK